MTSRMKESYENGKIFQSCPAKPHAVRHFIFFDYSCPWDVAGRFNTICARKTIDCLFFRKIDFAIYFSIFFDKFEKNLFLTEYIVTNQFN